MSQLLEQFCRFKFGFFTLCCSECCKYLHYQYSCHCY